jgi:hypothetical protein
MALPALPTLSPDATPDVRALWHFLVRCKAAIDDELPASFANALDVGSLGYSAKNPLAAVTTSNTPATPAVPTGLTATGFFKQIGLSWNLDVNPTILYWELQRATDAGFTLNRTPLSRVVGFAYLDSALAVSTTYFYRIKAGGQGGVSAFSAGVSATTLADTSTVVAQLTIAARALQQSHILP